MANQRHDQVLIGGCSYRPGGPGSPGTEYFQATAYPALRLRPQQQTHIPQRDSEFVSRSDIWYDGKEFIAVVNKITPDMRRKKQRKVSRLAKAKMRKEVSLIDPVHLVHHLDFVPALSSPNPSKPSGVVLGLKLPAFVSHSTLVPAVRSQLCYRELQSMIFLERCWAKDGRCRFKQRPVVALWYKPCAIIVPVIQCRRVSILRKAMFQG